MVVNFGLTTSYLRLVSVIFYLHFLLGRFQLTNKAFVLPGNEFYEANLIPTPHIPSGFIRRSTRESHRIQTVHWTLDSQSPQRLFTRASCLFRQSGVALCLLYMAGDLELNPGPGLDHDKTRRNIESSLVFIRPLVRALTLAHLNVRGIRSALDQLRNLMKTKTMDVLTLIETWLAERITSEEYEIDGYFLLRRDRVNANGLALLHTLTTTMT